MDEDVRDAAGVAGTEARADRQGSAGGDEIGVFVFERGRGIGCDADRQRGRGELAIGLGRGENEGRVPGLAGGADQAADGARAVDGEAGDRHAVDGGARTAIDRHLRASVVHAAELQKASPGASRKFGWRGLDRERRAGQDDGGQMRRDQNRAQRGPQARLQIHNILLKQADSIRTAARAKGSRRGCKRREPGPGHGTATVIV